MGLEAAFVVSSRRDTSNGGAHEKLGLALRVALGEAKNDEDTRFHVMISFRGPPVDLDENEATSPECMRRAFENQARRVRKDLIASGANDVELMWIARALTARASRMGLLRAARHADVTRIDLVESKNALI